jgi:hypothetical protein
VGVLVAEDDVVVGNKNAYLLTDGVAPSTPGYNGDHVSGRGVSIHASGPRQLTTNLPNCCWHGFGQPGQGRFEAESNIAFVAPASRAALSALCFGR